MIYETIKASLTGSYERAWDSFGMLVLDLPVANIVPVVERLRTEFGFSLFLDVTAVDHPEREPRFDVVYHFLSPKHHKRIRLKAQVPLGQPTVPTLTTMYGAARFMERETHEMYGIEFAGNTDLRPILLYEGFVGHPLRKDYPIDQEQPIVPYRR